MLTDTMAHVRAHLSEILDQVEQTHERVTITRNGRPSAILLSAEDLESLEETLELLSDPEALAELQQAREQVARGESYTEDHIRHLLEQRRAAR